MSNASTLKNNIELFNEVTRLLDLVKIRLMKHTTIIASPDHTSETDSDEEFDDGEVNKSSFDEEKVKEMEVKLHSYL